MLFQFAFLDVVITNWASKYFILDFVFVTAVLFSNFLRVVYSVFMLLFCYFLFVSLLVSFFLCSTSITCFISFFKLFNLGMSLTFTTIFSFTHFNT